MCHKWEAMGLNGFMSKELEKIYAENMKEIMRAVWELPAKKHSKSSPIWEEMGRIGCAV